jgi:hypothetical protein
VNPEWITRVSESRDPLAPDPVVTIRARNGSRWVRHEDQFAVLADDAAKRAGSRRKRLLWILAAGTVIAAGVVELIVSRFWTPEAPPPLEFQASDIDGTLVFRWNDDAVKGIGHAEIFITDGDRGRVIPLNRSQLSAGELRYVRKSARVTATLTAGRQQVETSFTAPAPRRKKTPFAPAPPQGTAKAP